MKASKLIVSDPFLEFYLPSCLTSENSEIKIENIFDQIMGDEENSTSSEEGVKSTETPIAQKISQMVKEEVAKEFELSNRYRKICEASLSHNELALYQIAFDSFSIYNY